MSAIQATVARFQSLADGTLRLIVDVHQVDTEKALMGLARVGQLVGIAGIRDDVQVDPLARCPGCGCPEGELHEEGCPVLEEDRAKLAKGLKAKAKTKGPYGKPASYLFVNGFFLAPAVCKALGKDREYLDSLRKHNCAHCNLDEPSEPAHVRTVGKGAGASIKPPYSAIPLCHECHTKQHASGYNGGLGRDMAWAVAKSARYLQDWGHERLKRALNADSLSDVNPAVLRVWAVENELNAYLPDAYRKTDNKEF